MAVVDATQSTLAYSTDGTVYTPVTQLRTLEPASLTREQVDTTHKGSTHKSSRPSYQGDGGSITGSGDYSADEASHVALATMFADQDFRYWKVTLSDGATIVFDEGYLADFSIGEDSENVSFSFTVKVNGLPTITAGV